MPITVFDPPTATMTAWTVIKNAMYIPAFLLGMSMHSFTILFALIVLDMVTGVWRGVVTNGANSITSFAFINGLVSKMLFMLIPLVIAYIGKGIGVDLHELATGCLSVLILGQGYSVIGNIYTIRTGVPVTEFDAVKLILAKLRDMIDSITISQNKSHK